MPFLFVCFLAARHSRNVQPKQRDLGFRLKEQVRRENTFRPIKSYLVLRGAAIISSLLQVWLLTGDQYVTGLPIRERKRFCVLSPFLIGRMFVREPSWKYSANLAGS